MNTFLGYIFTPLFHLYYVLLLVLFHPVQAGARHLLGDQPRRQVVDFLNHLLVLGLGIMGARFKFKGFEKVPQGRPLIIVSNHQSLYDIPAVVHGFRKYYPKFISKKELGKNIPTISYNLKYGKSALIDRSNGSQSVKEIFKLGRLIEQNNYAACIFPEGTRSKDGNVREFKVGGLATLVRAAPSAIIIPFVIDGHSRMMYKGMYPMKFGQKITYTVLDPIEPKGQQIEELVSLIEARIKQNLGQ